jgi:broad specificity phosphatase PhoE
MGLVRILAHLCALTPAIGVNPRKLSKRNDHKNLASSYFKNKKASFFTMEPMPLRPEPPEGSHKKVIYMVRHAEALHNVKEREAVQALLATGETSKERQEEARKAVLRLDPSLKDAPLSSSGTEQARISGQRLHALFSSGSSPVRNHPQKRFGTPNSPFRRPDVVLVSPLRRALMTATELFYHADNDNGDDPPMFLAIEALREKRTGLECDERSSVTDLMHAFPHVDFSDVERGIPVVHSHEGNQNVRDRVAEFIDHRLAAVPAQHLAIVSHKGWLREFRCILKSRVESGLLRVDFDINEWDTKLFGNAEVRVAAFRWQDGELISVVSRSVDNAMLASSAMMGDGFEFALGPPSSGFSIFLADRTTKVHFISIAEGRHNVAIREAAAESAGNLMEQSEEFLLRETYKSASSHPLHDARLTKKGARQAEKLRDMLAHRPSGGRPFTAFDLVIVSPLTRALETAEIIFGKTPGTYAGVELPPPRVLVREECRERYGRYVCDGRRSVRELWDEFPMFDFSEMPCDEDRVHTDDREPGVEVRERALRLLEWLNARPERCIAVVTHSEFLRHLFGQFGDTLHAEDRTCLQRTGANSELRSVVLCSHGPVEREEMHAPASTIRVPSSSSLSSLTHLESE